MIWQQQHAAAGGVDPATLFEAFAALGRAFGELIDIVAETGRRMVAVAPVGPRRQMLRVFQRRG